MKIEYMLNILDFIFYFNLVSGVTVWYAIKLR